MEESLKNKRDTLNAYLDTHPEKTLNFLPDDRIVICLHLPRSLTRETALTISSFSKKQGIDALIAADTQDYKLYAVRKSLPIILHTQQAVADMLPTIPKQISGVWHDSSFGGAKIASLNPAEIAWQEVVEYMHLRRKLDYLISFNTADLYKFDERVRSLAGWTGGMILLAEKGGLPTLENVRRISELAPYCPLFMSSALQDVEKYLPYIHGVIIDLTRFEWNASVVREYVSDLKNKIAALSH